MPNNDILIIRAVADYFRLAEKTVYSYSPEDKILSFKFGGAWRFRKSEIDRWIVEQEKQRGITK